MPRALITGSSGLIGSEAVAHFCSLGWDVIGVDSNARRDYFGSGGDTTPTLRRLRTLHGQRFKHRNDDIRHRLDVHLMMRDYKPDLILHCAAQPSHDYAADHPFEDWETNATGTLNLLEACRQFCPEAVFVFMSTNKVYGDSPNRFSITETATRYEPEHDFDEHTPLDQATHSLFGVSKAAADLMVQEYGRYFGLRTTCLRGGCLTGPSHAGVEQHGFLSYLFLCARDGRKYTIYGYKGKQVRDNIHAHDVVTAVEAIFDSPRSGVVYNIGGGRDNSCSVLEAIMAAESRYGRRMETTYVETPRKGDHMAWVTDTGRLRADYPSWGVTRSLDAIYEEFMGDYHENDTEQTEIPAGAGGTRD